MADYDLTTVTVHGRPDLRTMWLETERLLLRRPFLSDASGLQSILGDEDAMRYTFKVANLRECRRHIAGHECQRRKVGFGPWIVFEKAGRTMIGFGGLYDDPFDPGWGTEVGYQFAKWAWGNGYATELTNLCLKMAHEHLRIREVRAFAHPDNTASHRVLKKSGFALERFVPEMNRNLFVHRGRAPLTG